MKTFLKFILYSIIILACILGLVFLYAYIKNYKPDEIIKIYRSNEPVILKDSLELSIISWNLGYCGLDADMDFIYEGGSFFGKKVKKRQTKDNFENILNVLKQNTDADIVLLQEVDKRANRSRRINQFSKLAEKLPEYNNAFWGKNMDVFYVPLLGKIRSGLLSFSKLPAGSAVRRAYPSNYQWHKELLWFDRCFISTRYFLKSGKELIVINTHNSDIKDSAVMVSEMEYLKKFMLDEYSKGNYIVAGGTWNQCPPEFSKYLISNTFVFDTEYISTIPTNYMSGWTWMYDKTIPTKRRLNNSYDPLHTPTTVADFFLVSPNIEAISTAVINLNFKYSDHQPVKMKIKLK